MRIIKSKKEIEVMKKAGEVVALTLKKIEARQNCRRIYSKMWCHSLI